MSEISRKDPNTPIYGSGPGGGPDGEPFPDREAEALAYRQAEATRAADRDPAPLRNRNNGEEQDLLDPVTGFRIYAANSTKGMPHNGIGEVEGGLGSLRPAPVPVQEVETTGGEALTQVSEDEQIPASGGPQPVQPIDGEPVGEPDTDPGGEPPFTAYDALLQAVNSGAPADFAAIPIGPNRDPQAPIETILPPPRPFVDPQNGIAFDLEGPDAPSAATYRGNFRPDASPVPERILLAPRFETEHLAADVGEVYLMALLRDTHVTALQGTPAVQSADVDRAVRLMNEFTDYRGPTDASGQVTTGTLFRGGNVLSENGKGSQNVGELDGPFVSQFLIIGSRLETAFPPSRTSGTGDKREAGTAATGVPQLRRADGRVLYGTLTIDQTHFEVQPAADFVTDYDTWLRVLQGARPADLPRTADQSSRYTGRQTFLYSLRQMAEYVHRDQTFQEGLIAALLILSMNERAERLALRPRPAGAPPPPPLFNPGNAYLRVANQTGFGSFGNGHVLALLAEATTRAVKAAWNQKWFNHRRVRPEVLAGRIHNVLRQDGQGVDPSRYSINEEITGLDRVVVTPSGELSVPTAPGAELMAWVAQRNAQQNAANGRPTAPSFLLGQQYPEGSPTHPSYPAGHATQIAAEVTVMKGLFNEDFPITDFDDPALVPSSDGTALVAYMADPNIVLTLGGELNKLAANVSLARSIAGVHYRLDYSESALLGEYVGLGILQEQAQSFNNADFFFELTLFSGVKVRVLSDGRIVRAPAA